MECNMLKLNNDKIEFIVFKSSRNVDMFTGESIQVGSTAMRIKNLCYSEQVERIGRFLDTKDYRKIVYASIIPRLDY